MKTTRLLNMFDAARYMHMDLIDFLVWAEHQGVVRRWKGWHLRFDRGALDRILAEEREINAAL